MKTTELFIEQILIGGLALITGALLISDDLVGLILDVNIGSAMVLIGTIYLLGIVYDRVADTILQDLEQNHRIWYSLRRWKQDPAWDSKEPKGDPFPENIYRTRIFESESASDQLNYIRTRIRLTRALTTLTPALTCGILLSILDAGGADSGLRYYAAAAVGLTYAFAFVLKVFPNEKISGYKPPKTYKLMISDVYNDYLAKTDYSFEKVGPRRGVLQYVFRYERVTWVGLLLIIAASVFAVASGQWVLGFIPVIGFLLVILFGWTWWRISQTYFKLLDDFNTVSKSSDPDHS